MGYGELNYFAEVQLVVHSSLYAEQRPLGVRVEFPHFHRELLSGQGLCCQLCPVATNRKTSTSWRVAEREDTLSFSPL